MYNEQTINDIEYKVFMKQKLEKEIENILSKKYSKEFRVSISADADILTDSELSQREKSEILKLISAYLLEFDIHTQLNQ
jgi:DNA repair photolyase